VYVASVRSGSIVTANSVDKFRVCYFVCIMLCWKSDPKFLFVFSLFIKCGVFLTLYELLTNFKCRLSIIVTVQSVAALDDLF